MRKFSFVLAIISLISLPAMAGPLEDGTDLMAKGNYQGAMSTWQPLAQRGDAQAQFKIGMLYWGGFGVPKNYTTGMAWFKQAANNGNTDAMMHIALLYKQGLGVAQSDAEALQWVEKAANAGSSTAKKALVQMRANGIGTAKNPAAATAAQQPPAAYQRPMPAKLLGSAPPPDKSTREKALLDKMTEREKKELFTKTYDEATMGKREAQMRLSKLYDLGVGTSPNLVQAYFWLGLSMSGSKQRVTGFVSDLHTRMTPAELAQAELLVKQSANEWSPAYVYRLQWTEDQRKATAIRYDEGIRAIRDQLTAEEKAKCTGIPVDELGAPIGGSKLRVDDRECHKGVWDKKDDLTRAYFKSFFAQAGVQDMERVVLLSEAKQKKWKAAKRPAEKCRLPVYGDLDLPAEHCAK